MSSRSLPPELDTVLAKNIRALTEARSAFDRTRGLQDRIAGAITRFTGSMTFVLLHGTVIVLWFAVNLGLLGIKPWDPYPFVMLAMTASVESIFLSTFVLISQNRAAALADRRADLDLQINLLAEHELTRLITVVDRIAEKVGVDASERAELRPLEHDVTPESVMAQIADVDAAANAPAKDAAD